MAAEWVWNVDLERWEGTGLWRCHACGRVFPATLRPLMRMDRQADGLGWCLCPHCGEGPPGLQQWDMTFDQLAAKYPDSKLTVSSPATLTEDEENARAQQDQQQKEDQGPWPSFTVAPGGQWSINGEPLP